MGVGGGMSGANVFFHALNTFDLQTIEDRYVDVWLYLAHWM